MDLISIITVNYRQVDLTVEFLRSVKDHAVGLSIEVILVDNGSLADDAQVYKSVFSDLVYIRSEQNLGFAGGNNLGISKAHGKYLLLLNNDTEILPGFFAALTKEMDDNPEIGILSPLILYFEESKIIQYAGYTAMNYYTGRNAGIAFRESDRGQFDKITCETGFCHGAAMMCRREDLENAGMMDERYFLYYEELDWCEKFRKIGKQVAFTGKAKIYHKESISVGKESSLKTYFMTRNRWLFIRRNTDFFTALVFSIYYLLVVFPKAQISYFIRKRPDLAKAAWKGIYWNLTHSPDSTDLGYYMK